MFDLTRLDIGSLVGQVDGKGLRITGEVAFDADDQPSGNMSFESTGTSGIFAAIGKSGIFADRDVAAFTNFLTLIFGKDAGLEPATVSGMWHDSVWTIAP